MKKILVFAVLVLSLVFGSAVSGFCASAPKLHSLDLNADNIIAIKLSAVSYDKSYSAKYNYSTEDREEIETIVKNLNAVYVKSSSGYKDFSEDGIRYDLTLTYADKSVIYSIVGTYVWLDYTGDVKYVINQYDFSAVLRIFEALKAEKEAAAE